MTKYNFSYSTIADVHAIASEETGKVKDDLHRFARDLERAGTASYDSQEYIYRDSPYGMEIVSMEDYESETEGDSDEEEE